MMDSLKTVSHKRQSLQSLQTLVRCGQSYNLGSQHSKPCALTEEGSTWARPSMSTCKPKEQCADSPFTILQNIMESPNNLTGHSWKGHVPCYNVHASKLPKNLWGEAINHVVWLKNRTPTCTLPDGKTPYKLLYNKKPDLRNV